MLDFPNLLFLEPHWSSVGPLFCGFPMGSQECFGIGNLLADAIEFGAASKVFRGTQEANDSSLMVGSVKTQLGATPLALICMHSKTDGKIEGAS